MKVGLIAMSAKPTHRGHQLLIETAASECDVVHLFVSTSDRKRPGEFPVLGKDMEMLWRSTIEASLPDNVEVEYGGSPVRKIYEFLGHASETSSDDTYVIYSDPVDLKANYATLDRYAGDLVKNGQVQLRPVLRPETVPVSGTMMRRWLAAGKKGSFMAHLPHGIDKELVWKVLSKQTPKVVTNKKRPGKSRRNETLLRNYLRLVVG